MGCDVRPERAIAFKLRLSEELIESCVLRKGWIFPLVVDDVDRLIPIERGFDVDDRTGVSRIFRIGDGTDNDMAWAGIVTLHVTNIFEIDFDAKVEADL